MKVLFDLVTPQFFIGGAGEYIRRVFFELKKICQNNYNLTLLVAIDSSLQKFSYKDLSIDALINQCEEVVDLSEAPLSSIIIEKRIDKLFIGSAQYWGGRYDVENVCCDVVCVIHDLQDEECVKNNIYRYVLPEESIKIKLKKSIKSFFKKGKIKKSRLSFLPILYKKGRMQIVTVSQYSKSSLIYNFGLDANRIRVLYSPQRIIEASSCIENIDLKHIIHDKKKYFLLLSGNRPLKNAAKVLSAFEKFVSYNPDSYLVTTGIAKSHFPNHIVLPYLSDSDLVILIKNCYALVFSSFFEGFGYPPIEAMSYGKPVLASFSTSIPEVCGNAPIYFSPFYETDIFSALCKLNESNYNIYSSRSLDRYNEINKLQNDHLLELLYLIIE